MKRCCTCRDEKPYEQFHRDKRRIDGRRSECKECSGVRERARRDYNREYSREWYEKNADRVVADRLVYAEQNPEKKQAHALVRQAVANGTLEKPEVCEGCAKDGWLHGHHHDYSKPLEVEWLCAACHRATHLAAA